MPPVGGGVVFVKLNRPHVLKSGELSITNAELGGPETENLAISASSIVTFSIFSGAFVWATLKCPPNMNVAMMLTKPAVTLNVFIVSRW